jgi:hypothetical protein
MVAQSRSTVPQASRQPTRVPLSILRTETVLSRFPIHHLTQGRVVTIHLTQTNAQGTLELRWDVSYNARYGPPGPLAYKLDTIVINQILDRLPRPLPRVLKVGSFRQLSTQLAVQVSGRQYAHLTRAFHQNASAYIVAYLHYRGRDGVERTLNAGFTRYSVIWTGERLPDGTPADAVYLVLSEPYWEVLNHAPVRPLDYTYLKDLTPMAQRFYELVSYKMFAALKYRHPHATLRYSEYCLLSTQQRYTEALKVQKQMYKVHQPHVHSGYLTKVHYARTTDADGRPDWLLQYTPGPKARAEYAAFRRQSRAEAAAAHPPPMDADQEDLLATVTRASSGAPPSRRREASLSPHVALAHRDQPAHATPRQAPTHGTVPSAPPANLLQTQAEALVQQFYQRFHGLAQVTPSPTELAHATALLAQHGAAKVHFLLAFAHQEAPATDYTPRVFGGILHYLPRALAAYDAQATRVSQAAAQHAAADERTWHERYLEWRQRELRRLRTALPPAELDALEDTTRARLVAAGTASCTLPFAVRFAVDEILDAQAGLLSFEAWRQTQEACG